ncbi:hypothetical protein [Scandinavium goeteborgense]|uniref:hypothetical protein n=1 Tax=Scandinavium goeteborgense TaxID=1851514 RepID=UPI000F67DCF9|nr:hypothetical protein [Scandinavium goeteborgense]QKN79786.1 hypothetical protein A8O29_000165 [Scandinavium goeteborgense]
MQILAHRGSWQTPNQRNSRQALNAALQAGWGVETDIRDHNGTLVISHDMATNDSMPLSSLLEDYLRIGSQGTLALNIKSDGLANELEAVLLNAGIEHYFCFDMSVPDTLAYINMKMKVAARLSEYEPEGILSALSSFLWIDGFHNISVNADQLHQWLYEEKKQVCIVSPELHGRSPKLLWAMLRDLPKELRLHPYLMICTDLPALAQKELCYE